MATCKDCLHYDVCERFGRTVDFSVDDGVCLDFADRSRYVVSYGTSAGNIVEVVRCQDCVHAVPLDRNCELSTSLYMHCGLWRGDETKNVWHKYKKYYKDYSLVYREDFCSAGEKIDGKDGE